MAEYKQAIIEYKKHMIFHNYQRVVNHFIPEIKIIEQLVECVIENQHWKSHI